MSDLGELLEKLLEEMVVEDQPEHWKGARFINQRKIQIDKRGSIGERFFLIALTTLYPRRIEYKDGDQGDWDLKIGKYKFEVKTSSLDKSGKFQNEGLKKDGDYNGILFLGIAPNDIYMYCIKIDNIDFENSKINYKGVEINLHNRGKETTKKRATGAGYKCDFRPEQMTLIKSLDDLQRVFEDEFGDVI